MQTNKKLNNGNTIPVLGLGTWRSEKNLVGNAVKFATTKAGYRHIDCAYIYGNEKEIGKAFTEVFKQGVKRKEIFITSKLWNTSHKSENVEKACRKTLSDLRLDCLDLYLMHWGIAIKPGRGLEPIGRDGKVVTENVSIQETWKAMESLVKKGLVRSIGVANFTTIMLVDLLTYAKIPPAMNQIELHPYNTQVDLVTFCKDKNIAVTAYSPLGRSGVHRDSSKGPKLSDERIVKKIAAKYKKTPSQILINWALSRGTITIPKSVTQERITENFDVFDFELTNSEQSEISSLNRNYRFVNPGDFWGIPYFV